MVWITYHLNLNPCFNLSYRFWLDGHVFYEYQSNHKPNTPTEIVIGPIMSYCDMDICRNGDPIEKFNGRVSGLTFFDTALTQSQVLSLMDDSRDMIWQSSELWPSCVPTVNTMTIITTSYFRRNPPSMLSTTRYSSSPETSTAFDSVFSTSTYSSIPPSSTDWGYGPPTTGGKFI